MKFKLHHKTPLPLVFGLVLNLILIITIEVLAVYRYPLEMTQADFAGISDRYVNCTILDESGGETQYYLIKTQEGQVELIPMRRHVFFVNRAKVVKNKITPAEKLDETGSIQILSGGIVETVTVTGEQITQVQGFGGFGGVQAALAIYFLEAGILAFFELYLIEKIKGNI